LRIAPQELWDAAKVRQDHLTGLYIRQIESARKGIRRNVATNGGRYHTHRECSKEWSLAQ
jgi:site-specific DNA recombinase